MLIKTNGNASQSAMVSVFNSEETHYTICRTGIRAISFKKYHICQKMNWWLWLKI